MSACKIIFGDRKYIVLHNNVTFIFNLFRKGQCMINRHFKKDKIISIPHIHYYQSQPFLNFGQFLITLACIFTTAVATILFLIPNNIKSTIVWESHPSQAFSTPSTTKKLKKKKTQTSKCKRRIQFKSALSGSWKPLYYNVWNFDHKDCELVYLQACCMT